ncbi:hypothetical protein DOTSEDRAFT_56638, partial [Dothistroma septosporum NZE10]
MSSNPLCHLLTLPLELREQIYTATLTCTDTHAFCVWNGLLLSLVDGHLYKLFTHKPWNSGTSLQCGTAGLPLLRTSRQIHSEASRIFHETLSLQLHVDGRYRSPTEIRGLSLGAVEDVGFLRGVREWDITVRLRNVEDAERLVAQLDSLRGIVEGRRVGVEWKSVSVQISRYADEEDEEGGRKVLGAVRGLTGVEELVEGGERYRELTRVYCWERGR